MKKFLVCIAFLAGLIASPVFAEEVKHEPVRVESKTSTYDDDYWTRVWYQKQAAKGIHYKNHVYRNGKRVNKKYSKGSSKKRRSAKKRNRSRKVAAYRPSARDGGRVVARVSLSRQRMDVYRGGRLLHTWKVSTGRSGYSTPRGTWRIHRMHKRYFSRKYNNAPMPHAMFYHRGFAIHGTNSISRLGRRASHGCVRLHPSNAARLFAMVRRHGGTVRVTN
ncbi:MAG: L,D-transpeptidase [Ahrensia sp.]|nr:L,D-transpeptidase [Ahrensia sp.]